ncbi:hypothetical protein HLB44_14690 [Aquincola sp. S2]|uniref:AI-2E family transporter n=1 Tax=Pseudaquabacterium terrae TaxID=2732868 RepID=A0ABX2EHX8_9BURK|nr:hypothetical protein [Aquabacterium terrae]NRF68238.1 hypothetical protein [Aquabacterium terrae]
MEIQPKTLGIPLRRNARWGFVLAAACACVAAASWAFNPAIGLVLAVSCAVVLPALWPFLFPPHLLRNRLPRLLAYVLMVGYLALAKVAIIPFFVRLLHASTAA